MARATELGVLHEIKHFEMSNCALVSGGSMDYWLKFMSFRG